MTVFIGEWYKDANNYIQLYWSAANEITLLYNMNGGGDVSDVWNATGAIDANTQYTFQIEYTGSGNMVFSVDEVAKITLAGIPAAFGAALDTSYWGSQQAGGLQADAVYDTVAAAVGNPWYYYAQM